ncbi:MAG: hypothetical protein O6933_03290, partial [Planctomycetota bacterium]|nr:hypothetical protein [Planctomycetota bacterium]
PIAQPASRFEADVSDAQLAIDVQKEASQAPGRSPDEPPAPPHAAEPPAAPDEGDYTSRLLAAKRRARDQADRRTEDQGDA